MIEKKKPYPVELIQTKVKAYSSKSYASAKVLNGRLFVRDRYGKNFYEIVK